MSIKSTFFLDQGETLGGAEYFLIDFMNALNDAEYRRLYPIVAGAKNKNYKKKMPKKIEILDFDFPSVRGGIFRKIIAGFRIFFAARRLKNLAKEKNAIRFFSNTPRTHFVMLLARKFWRLEGLWVAFFHDFTTRPGFLLQYICNNADFLLVNSLPTRKYLREKIHHRNFEKIKIVENGLDFTDIPVPQPSEKIEKILCLGRIDPRKGQRFLVEVAYQLKKTKPDLHFFIVGDHFPEDKRTVAYEKEIRGLAAKYELENLYFLPAVKNPFEIIPESDMMVVLPTEPETFGRVVIEALSFGKLVLAFDETGPREILKNFETYVHSVEKGSKQVSLRVEKQNAEALAEKISFFTDHPEAVRSYTAHARAFAQQNFSLRDTKKRLLNVLLENY